MGERGGIDHEGPRGGARREESAGDPPRQESRRGEPEDGGEAERELGAAERLDGGGHEPVDARGFVGAEVAVECRDDVIAAGDHLDGGAGEAGLVAVPERGGAGEEREG